MKTEGVAAAGLYGPAEDVFSAARTRRSIRAYRTDPVPRDIVREIVELGRWAPSGSNIQPWRVHVLTGAALRRVIEAMRCEFMRDEPERRDYQYYTDPVEEPYLARRRACGWGLYGLLGIGRGDREKSKAYRARNYEFFGAPVGMVFTIERKLEKGSWLDYGMFLQNIMVAARARGLDTCPQAAFTQFHRLIAEQLGLPDSEMVVCGMSLGVADPDAVENRLVTERAPVEAFTTFLD